MLNTKCGFSLIELIIVLAIISILAGVAYPCYNRHLITARRTYATVALTDVAARLEQYYTQNNSYTGATLDGLGASDASYKNYYQLKITQATNDQYTISAIPLNKQAQEDADCGTLTLDQTGNKNITGSGKAEVCWE